MKTLLKDRTICVVGGNGFVGTAVAQQAVAFGARVFAVSRRGTPSSKAQWAEKVFWVKGNAMDPSTFKGVLEESEAVVHTIGTLIDSSITRNKKPGEEGTYEQMNRDAAQKVAKTLSEFNDNKKMVYLSASKSPPFIPRYLDTKLEAENYLFGLPNLRGTALRPGFISSDEVANKKLLSYPVGLYANAYKFFEQRLNPSEDIKRFLKNFDVDTTIDVRAVALSAVIASFDEKFDGRVLFNPDMELLWERFLERGYTFAPKATPEAEKIKL